jgi:endoplasmic reticulum-Golgi intermediate compartment protein 3
MSYAMLMSIILAGVHQCVREGQAFGLLGSNDNSTDLNEGCRVHGHLEVNKVAGNFHIAPGQSFQQHHLHVHSLRNIRLNRLNTTHSIDSLSFGEFFPNQINPLSDTVQIANDGAVLFHYYVKIVPSTYVFLNRTEVRTNQYSVTKHRKTILNIVDMNGHQLPGTFFNYEISAIMVKFVEQRRSFAHFLTSSCAIIVSRTCSYKRTKTNETYVFDCLGWCFHCVKSHRCLSISW